MQAVARFALLPLFLAGTIPAVAQPCPLAETEVVVTTPAAAVEVIPVPSVKDYAHFPGTKVASMAPGWVINGLTVVTPSVGYRMQGWRLPGCYGLGRVEITLAYASPMRVYVSDKYREGSCAAEAIEAHEMQHVEIYRRGQEAFAPHFKEKVASAVREAAMTAARSPNGEAILKAAVEDALDEARGEMMRRIGAANARMDTVENYKLTQAQCDRW